MKCQRFPHIKITNYRTQSLFFLKKFLAFPKTFYGVVVEVVRRAEKHRAGTRRKVSWAGIDVRRREKKVCASPPLHTRDGGREDRGRQIEAADPKDDLRSTKGKKKRLARERGRTRRERKRVTTP